MPAPAGLAAGVGPSSVSVHDDRHVRRGFSPRRFDELLTKDLIGTFLFIKGVLGFHELSLQDLHTLMQQGIAAAFFEIGPLRTDECRVGAADVMRAGLEEIEFAEAGFGGVGAVDSLLDRALAAKPLAHDFRIGGDAGAATSRHMSVTGG